MRRTLQWPFGIAVVMFVAKFCMLQYTPETAPSYTEVHNYISLQDYASQNPGVYDTGSRLNQPISSTSLPSDHDPNVNWLRRFYQLQNRQLQKLFHIRGIPAILANFAIKRIAFASLAFVFQYASEVLQQDLSRTFLIRVFHQISVAVLFTCLLPLFTRRLSSPFKDLWIVRVSLIVLTVGFFVVWNGRSLLGLVLGMSTLRSSVLC